jgi:hypothetical protein
VLSNLNFFLYCSLKIVFSIQHLKIVSELALLYTLMFEKTGLLEKSTFQTPVNVSEFGLRKTQCSVYSVHCTLHSCWGARVAQREVRISKGLTRCGY